MLPSWCIATPNRLLSPDLAILDFRVDLKNQVENMCIREIPIRKLKKPHISFVYDDNHGVSVILLFENILFKVFMRFHVAGSISCDICAPKYYPDF